MVLAGNDTFLLSACSNHVKIFLDLASVILSYFFSKLLDVDGAVDDMDNGCWRSTNPSNFFFCL